MLSRITALACVCAFAQPGSGWRLTRSAHFEVYSQAGDATARPALAWFEQLRAFFQQQTGLILDQQAPVRVIAFRSPNEYQPYRLSSASDSYYVGTGSRDYIVMAGLGADEFRVSAHEYAHLILHASGLHRPSWLNEGLAEFYSTVRIGPNGSTLGGAAPSNIQILRRRAWLPLAELLTTEAAALGDRDRAALFYAQTWALTEMLVLSPEYGARFPALITALSLGEPSVETLVSVNGKSVDAIARDVHAWVDGRNKFTPVALPGVAAGEVAVEFSDVSPFAARSLLAELVLASGNLQRAESLYRDLAHDAPDAADVSAALGTIALRKGDYAGAREQWKRAIGQGVRDATLCYSYATLAGMAGLPADEVRPALERALALKPGYDDARYTLALLEKNASHYDVALEHLRAMRNVAPVRAFSYWIALADTLRELDKREEATAAAQKAGEYASTPAERARAASIAYMAQTDLAVEFTRDANGRQQMATTRIPHNSTDWNPFIERGDDVRRVQGTLREIQCSKDMMRMVVDTAAGPLRLSIPDPSRVQMRNAPAEFTCGLQHPASAVTAEYAASKTQGANGDGVVRGLEFR